MSVWRAAIGIACWAAISVGCRSGPPVISGGGDGHVDQAASDACSFAGGPPRSCGGTVSLGGTTPIGSFAADAIYALRVVQCDAQMRLIEMEIGDTSSRDVLFVNVLRSQDDGGAMFVGRHAAAVTFHAPQACRRLDTSGTVDITEQVDPGPGSAPGHAKGTLSLSGDGFALSGSFDAPYCGLTSGQGCP
jgi:hypothetical protein